MLNYRRAFVRGGCWFSAVNLLDRPAGPAQCAALIAPYGLTVEIHRPDEVTAP
jgi:hypothetical protein